MEKKNNGILVGILIGIIITSLVIICLFATGTIELKNNSTKDNKQTSTINDETGVNNNSSSNENYDAVAIAKTKIPTILSLVNQSKGAYTYCGDVESSNDISNNTYTYYVSTKFKTLSELKKYLDTISTTTIYNKYLKNDSTSYVEQNGKLYCAWMASGKSFAVFSTEKGINELNNLNYEVTDKKDNSFNVKVSFTIESSSYEYNVSFAKENDIWLINSLEEN